jgi:DNA topoisomerase-1
MSTLVIVESPSKAKTIKKYLGAGFDVKASVGHVRDLPKTNSKAIDIEGGFVPNYEISKDKTAVIAELKAAAKKAKTVLLATDPDREGEAIAWHVAELIKKDNKHLSRIVFHEITEDAVKEAIEHPRPIDQNLRRAQEARRVLDRLVGYDLSGLIWKKVRYGLSAGRVQSPAVRIVMEREREIRAFIPETFYTITADTTHEKDALALTCIEEPREATEAERILAVGKRASWTVTEVVESEQKRSPRPPFTTSTLQQTASTRLGFSPSRTMRAAQKLYEQGFITYMRTDSVTLSKVALGEIGRVIEHDFGKEHLTIRTWKTSSKSAQEAHEAIRPTHATTKHAGTTDDERRLYELIWRRTLASQMADAKQKKTRIEVLPTPTGSDAAIPLFTANGSRTVYDGWLLADPSAKGDDTELPKMSSGDVLTLVAIRSDEKQTQPPSRYTEAGLIKELEKRGIGRPSTYASIMNTIVARGYVEKDGRTLKPTDVGDVVSTFLEENFAEYISDTFTSDMEDELDGIANGDRDYEKTLRAFYKPFKKHVDSKENIDKLTTLGDAPSQFPCPKCGSHMVVKLGKSGKFLSCARFPDCDGSRLIDGSEIKATEPIGSNPTSGLPIFVLNGKYGPYVQEGITPEKPKGRRKKGDPKPEEVKPRRASIPKGVSPADVTLEIALHYLSLPRVVGTHPETNAEIVANIGRFGPYLAYQGEFRSLKKGDDPYTITLERAVEILAQPKQGRKGEKIVKEIGLHPRTKKKIRVYESKSGRYLKKGFKRFMLPEKTDLDTFTVEEAADLMK